jgi:hypothetical protein
MLTDTVQKIRPRSMVQLSPTGLRAVEEIAQRNGFSRDAVTSMLFSLVAGGGGMAQFSHSEFGGLGQWMAGGPIMISDMFNNALKARVDALCSELSALIRSEPDFVAAASFQSQSQGAPRNLRRGSSSHLVTDGLTKRIGGLRILASLPASEHRTKSATPIFPTPSASPSTSTGR